jgi:hypothetical protein
MILSFENYCFIDDIVVGNLPHIVDFTENVVYCFAL